MKAVERGCQQLIPSILKVLEDNSSIFAEPSLESHGLVRMPAGHVLLNTGSEEIGSLMWSRVLLGAQKYGWIVRVSPPQMGVPVNDIIIRVHIMPKNGNPIKNAK